MTYTKCSHIPYFILVIDGINKTLPHIKLQKSYMHFFKNAGLASNFSIKSVLKYWILYWALHCNSDTSLILLCSSLPYLKSLISVDFSEKMKIAVNCRPQQTVKHLAIFTLSLP